MAVLSLLLVLLAQALSGTQDVMVRARARSGQFQEARNAFDTLTRRLSQATLNAYWDYDDPFQPTRYVRQSGLHFVSGPVASPAAPLLPDLTTACGHAVFFTAPLGYAGTEAGTRAGAALDLVEEAVNGWGFFVQYRSDLTDRPAWMQSDLARHPERRRFCLMEFRQPAESLPLYLQLPETSGGDTILTPAISRQTSLTGLHSWFQRGVIQTAEPAEVLPLAPGSRVLARNILALLISPRLPTGPASADCPYDIAPTFYYDTRQHQLGTPVVGGSTRHGVPVPIASRHQLPPVLQIHLIALDEASWDRYLARGGSETKYLNLLRDRFQFIGPVTAPGRDGYERNLREELALLTTALDSDGIDHRIFSADIALRAAKWTSDADRP